MSSVAHWFFSAASSGLVVAGCSSATVPIGIDGADGGGSRLTDAAQESATGPVSSLDGTMSDADEMESGGSGPRCEGGAGAPVSPDAAACFIDLAKYDSSCAVDSDCVSTVELSCAVNQTSTPVENLYVRGGNFCNGCNCNTGIAINRSAVQQYIADVSATPEGSGEVAFPICNCPPTPPVATPICVNGSCSPSPVDSGLGD
jgi:hypothetical protein